MSLLNEPNDVTGMYEVIYNTDNDTTPVRILEGKFKNFVYKYGKIQVGEFNDNDSDVPLKYEYDLLEAPSTYEIDNEDNEKLEFEHLIGDVLYDIIVNSKNVKEANGDRNDDT